MSITCIINLVLGLAFLYHAWAIIADTKTGDGVVGWVRKTGQGIFGEDWHVHEYIVAGILMIVGAFFCMMAFSIFAAKHDWWVLKWL